MNLRCIYCQTPFTLPRSEMLGAIVTMNEKSQNHYDAHCPRCRRANSISRQRMELFYPNWKEAAKQQASMTEETPPPPASVPASVASETVPLPKKTKAAAKKAPAKSTTAKKTTAAKPAASTTKAKKAPSKDKKK